MIFPANSTDLDAKRIMVDANVVIGHLDSKHKFHTTIKKKIQDLFIEGSTFYFSQPSLLETKNYWRRKLLTECIQTHLDSGRQLFRDFQKLYLDFKERNKGEALGDRQIKELRQTIEKIHSGKGVEYWALLCDQAMADQFKKLENTLASSNFKYAKLNDDDVFPLPNKPKWPQWEHVDGLIEKHGLGSNDAAIINMVNGAKDIDGFISNDGDLLFAIAKGALVANVRTFTFLDVSPYV